MTLASPAEPILRKMVDGGHLKLECFRGKRRALVLKRTVEELLPGAESSYPTPSGAATFRIAKRRKPCRGLQTELGEKDRGCC